MWQVKISPSRQITQMMRLTDTIVSSTGSFLCFIKFNIKGKGRKNILVAHETYTEANDKENFYWSLTKLNAWSIEIQKFLSFR